MIGRLVGDRLVGRLQAWSVRLHDVLGSSVEPRERNPTEPYLRFCNGPRIHQQRQSEFAALFYDERFLPCFSPRPVTCTKAICRNLAHAPMVCSKAPLPYVFVSVFCPCAPAPAAFFPSFFFCRDVGAKGSHRSPGQRGHGR